MTTSTQAATVLNASSPYLTYRDLPEEEHIAKLIKLFGLEPVSRKPKVISISADTETGFYDRQDPNHSEFDPSYPEPIGGRRSKKSSRCYWTVEILSWRIRQAKTGIR